MLTSKELVKIYEGLDDIGKNRLSELAGVVEERAQKRAAAEQQTEQ